jgi:hypothetical protein
VLLHARVQVPLDHAAVGIGGQDEPSPGGAELRDLEAQPVERFAQLLDVPSIQGGSTSCRGLAEVVRHRTTAVKEPAPL